MALRVKRVGIFESGVLLLNFLPVLPSHWNFTLKRGVI